MQAVVNLDNVKSVPGLGKVTELPFVTQVLQGILPTIGEFCSLYAWFVLCCDVVVMTVLLIHDSAVFSFVRQLSYWPVLRG